MHNNMQLYDKNLEKEKKSMKTFSTQYHERNMTVRAKAIMIQKIVFRK